MVKRNVLIVINKASGNGLANKVNYPFFSFLKGRNIPFFPYYTTGVDDIRNIQRLLDNKDFDTVSVLGGDGTLNLVINAIGHRNINVHIIPCGSGNDISNRINGKMEITRHFYAILNKTSTPLDIFSCNDRLFVVSFGIGFEGSVCESVKIQRRSWMPTSLRYWIAILRNLMFYKDVEIEMYDQKKKIFLLSLANNDKIGGGFQMAPHADVNDGLMELVVISDVPKRKRIKHMLDVKVGKHLDLPYTEYKRVSSFAIYSDNEIPAHVDGELLYNNNYVLKYSHSLNFLS